MTDWIFLESCQWLAGRKTGISCGEAHTILIQSPGRKRYGSKISVVTKVFPSKVLRPPCRKFPLPFDSYAFNCKRYLLSFPPSANVIKSPGGKALRLNQLSYIAQRNGHKLKFISSFSHFKIVWDFPGAMHKMTLSNLILLFHLTTKSIVIFSTDFLLAITNLQNTLYQSL